MTGTPARQTSVFDMIAEFKRIQAQLAALPPRPRCIRAHHSVPFGRCFKQWMTNGDLIVWANRGELEDLPRRTTDDVPNSMPWGIPVGVES